MNKPAKPFTDTSPDWVACSDEHTPSHEEIYEMAVQDKADDMDIKALSDAATGGTWHGVGYMVETDNDNAADPASCSAAMYGQDRITDHDEQCANATFIAALVNLYRSGDLLPRADLSPVGTVRKLVWDDRQSANPHMHYRVHIGYGVEYGHFNLTYCGSTIGEYSSETEAKAAAQAHHDAYILSQVEAQPTWRGMESAPRDGTKVRVVSVEDGEWYQSDIAWWDSHSDRWENGTDYDQWNLTYWMPLPTPPSEGA